jgi:hypothetical protein
MSPTAVAKAELLSNIFRVGLPLFVKERNVSYFFKHLNNYWSFEIHHENVSSE